MELMALKRTFSYGGMNLPDPDVTMTPIEVRDFYAASGSPELATAEVRETFDHNTEVLEITFHRAVGTKGLLATQASLPSDKTALSERIELALAEFTGQLTPQIDPKHKRVLENLRQRREDDQPLQPASTSIPWML